MPSFDFWREVSSNRITPDRYCSTPGVPKRSWRYARRVSSVHSTFTDWKRFSQVPLDSSAARMPLTLATIAAAVLERSAVSMAISGLGTCLLEEGPKSKDCALQNATAH